MKTRPLYENLDTSFINFAALLRYLRGRRFVGCVRLETSGYEAEIFFLENDRVQVREHDLTAARLAKDQAALHRILLRARAPGAVVNVFQRLETGEAEAGGELKMAMAANRHSPPIAAVKAEEPDFAANLPRRAAEKFKTAALSPPEWQTLLNLTVELLGAIDKTLAEANLAFTPAFKKACAETSADYPFLNPAAEIFYYADGKLVVREQVHPKLFAAAINEVLRRILEKLAAKPDFSDVYRAVVQKILALAHRRRPLYNKFFITPQLERFLGV